MENKNRVNLEKVLRSEYKSILTNEEIDKIISKIDFNSNCVIEYFDNPSQMKYFFDLEYIKQDLYATALEFEKTCYGGVRYPSMAEEQNVKVAVEEKEEVLAFIRNPKDSLKPGKIEIINGYKTVKQKLEFDPLNSYIAVKKITHKITSVYNKEYSIYRIVIYSPSLNKAKRYIKFKNFIKKIK